jgi:hypothetical protein
LGPKTPYQAQAFPRRSPSPSLSKMDTSKSTTGQASQTSNNFFTTHFSKAFLDTYDNIPNYANAFLNTKKNMSNRNNNSTSQTNLASETPHRPEPPHIDIYFPSNTQTVDSQWSGTELAKKQAKQEQRVFAKRQCVRFGFCGDCSASSNDYGDDDYKDEGDEDKDGEQDIESRQPWQFSQLAKSFETKERKLFKAVAGRWLEEEEGEEEFL